MNFLVDAWLERADAFLRLIDIDSGREVLRWNHRQLQAAFDDGSISMEDLQSGQPAREEILGMIGRLGC